MKSKTMINLGNSLVVQWLVLGAFTAVAPGSIPGWGTNIPQDARCGQKKKNKDKFILSKLKTFFKMLLL